MSEPETRTRRWKRVEYDRLIELGFFRPGDPVELLGGHLIVAEPQGSGHFAAVRAAGIKTPSRSLTWRSCRGAFATIRPATPLVPCSWSR